MGQGRSGYSSDSELGGLSSTAGYNSHAGAGFAFAGPLCRDLELALARRADAGRDAWCSDAVYEMQSYCNRTLNAHKTTASFKGGIEQCFSPEQRRTRWHRHCMEALRALHRLFDNGPSAQSARRPRVDSGGAVVDRGEGADAAFKLGVVRQRRAGSRCDIRGVKAAASFALSPGNALVSLTLHRLLKPRASPTHGISDAEKSVLAARSSQATLGALRIFRRLACLEDSPRLLVTKGTLRVLLEHSLNANHTEADRGPYALEALRVIERMVHSPTDCTHAVDALWTMGGLVRMLGIVCAVNASGDNVDGTDGSSANPVWRPDWSDSDDGSNEDDDDDEDEGGDVENGEDGKDADGIQQRQRKFATRLYEERVLAARIISSMLHRDLLRRQHGGNGSGAEVQKALQCLMPQGLLWKFADGGAAAVKAYDSNPQDATPELLWWAPCRHTLQSHIAALLRRRASGANLRAGREQQKRASQRGAAMESNAAAAADDAAEAAADAAALAQCDGGVPRGLNVDYSEPLGDELQKGGIYVVHYISAVESAAPPPTSSASIAASASAGGGMDGSIAGAATARAASPLPSGTSGLPAPQYRPLRFPRRFFDVLLVDFENAFPCREHMTASQMQDIRDGVAGMGGACDVPLFSLVEARREHWQQAAGVASLFHVLRREYRRPSMADAPVKTVRVVWERLHAPGALPILLAALMADSAVTELQRMAQPFSPEDLVARAARDGGGGGGGGGGADAGGHMGAAEARRKLEARQAKASFGVVLALKNIAVESLGFKTLKLRDPVLMLVLALLQRLVEVPGRARAIVVQESLRKDVRLVPWLMDLLQDSLRKENEWQGTNDPGGAGGSLGGGSGRGGGSMRGGLSSSGGSMRGRNMESSLSFPSAGGDSGAGSLSMRGSVGREGSMRGRGLPSAGSVVGMVKQSLKGGRNYVSSRVVRIVKSMVQDEVKGGDVKKMLRSFPSWDPWDRFSWEAPIEPEEVLDEVRAAVPSLAALSSGSSSSVLSSSQLGRSAGDPGAVGKPAVAGSAGSAASRPLEARRPSNPAFGRFGHGAQLAPELRGSAGETHPSKAGEATLGTILRTPEGLGAFQSFVQTSEKFDDDATRFLELVLSYQQLYQQHAASVGGPGGSGVAASTRHAKQRTQAELLRRQVVEQFIEPDGFYRCVCFEWSTLLAQSPIQPS